MSETSLNTGEMLFQLRVWDYLAWALDDKRLDHVENLYYKGRPISVSTFANPNVPMVKCFDKAECRLVTLIPNIRSSYKPMACSMLT